MDREEAYWIGLSDGQEEGAFVWDSGHALSGEVAKHWSRGQPDNYKGGQDCGYIWKHDGKSGISNGMNDRSCTTKAKFVCQKPLGSRSTCPRRYRPVCGSNGRTYRNSCFAKRSLGRVRNLEVITGHYNVLTLSKIIFSTGWIYQLPEALPLLQWLQSS